MRFNPFSIVRDKMVNFLMGLTYHKCSETIKYIQETAENIKKKGFDIIVGAVEDWLSQESDADPAKCKRGLLYFIRWYSKRYKDSLDALNLAYTDIDFLRRSAEYKKDPGIVDKFLRVHKYINELSTPLETMYKTAIVMDLALKEGKKEKLRKKLILFKEQLEVIRKITIKYGY
ncbi:MAG: hypothetical protein V2A62_02635 [Candidatus Woesearchaeota archaeon]